MIRTGAARREPRSPSTRLWPIAVGACISGAALFPIAFIGFRLYDDEGYHLANVALALHGSVYAHSNVEYGPTVYTVLAGVFWLLHWSPTHDAARIITLGAWVVAAALGGIVAAKLTGRTWGGIVALICGLIPLTSLTNEPLQPAVVIEPLSVCIVIVIVSGPLNSRRLMLLGVVLASLALCKINIGGFALLAVLAALVMTGAGHGRWGRIAAALLLVAPVVVLAPLIRQPWVLELALTLVAAALWLAWAADHRPSRTPLPQRWWLALAGGLLAGGGAEVGLALLRGESLAGIVGATLIRPLSQVKGLVIPMNDAPQVLVLFLLFLAATTIGVQQARRRAAADRLRPSISTPALSASTGQAQLGHPGLSSGYQPLIIIALRGILGLMAALPTVVAPTLGAIAAVPCLVIFAPRRPAQAHELAARVMLAALALDLVYQVYPTAGSQVGFAGFLVTVCGSILLVEAISEGAALVSARIGNGRLSPPFVESRRKRIEALGWTVVCAALLLVAWEPQLAFSWRAYTSTPALALPGSRLLHLPRSDAATLVATTRYLDAHCRQLAAVPGLASFYPWTHLPPPSGFTLPDGGLWLEPSYQRATVRALRSASRPCIIQSPSVIRLFHSGSTLPYAGPLVRLIRTRYHLAATIGPYRIYQRRPGLDD